MTPTVQQTVTGPTVVINQELCKGCSLCVQVCAPEVLTIDEIFNHLGYHPVLYAGDGCTGCGVCFYACPEPGAIQVYKPPRRARG